MTEPKIEIGQVWESRDSRDSGRRVVVEEVDPSLTFVWVRSVRLSRLRLENLRRYYRLVEESS